jgi:AraC family transcriptional regulator
LAVNGGALAPDASVDRAFASPLLVRRAGVFEVTLTAHAAERRIPFHRHEGPYLCVVLAGAFIESAGVDDHECVPGSAIFHPGDDLHADRFGPNGARCLNVILGDAADAAIERTVANGEARLRSTAIARIARLAVRAMTGRPCDPGSALEDHVTELLAAVRPLERRSAGKVPRWIRRVADHINETAPERASLAGLARIAGVHPVHLSRSFRLCYGDSVTSYVRRRRLAWAHDRVTATRQPLAEIATEAGFADQAHFSHAFRAAYGMAPAAYRKARLSNTTPA